MSFFNRWWQNLLKGGIFVSWRKDWPGDEKLPPPNCWPKTVTKEDCEQEIRDSLKKEEQNGKPV